MTGDPTSAVKCQSPDSAKVLFLKDKWRPMGPKAPEDRLIGSILSGYARIKRQRVRE